MPKQEPPRSGLIWDVPTRLFHWLLVLLIGAAWATQEQLGDSERHATVGYMVLGLLLFRLLWGIVGSETARFRSFIRGPRAVRAYLAGDAPASVGHNPLGGYSVALMLLSLFVQAATGLFLYDDEAFWGPLNDFVSDDTSELLGEIHELNFNLLLGLIALHVGAILYYALVRRKNLVRPMIGGRGELPTGVPAPRTASSWAALASLAAAAGAVYAITSLG